MQRLFILLLTMVAVQLSAQDLKHYKQIVKELSSAKYSGRGYARDGANKAGEYLCKEFQKAGVDEVICQPFRLDVNTFPGKMSAVVDGRRLTTGIEYTLREFSPAINGTYKLYHIDTLDYDAKKVFKELALAENKGAMVVCDFWFFYKHAADLRRLQTDEKSPNTGVIYTWNEPLKYYKAEAHKVVPKPVMWALAESIPADSKSIEIEYESEFLEGYECFNVVAKVEGERHDSCYVFTAHYDHLGLLGRKVYYPGAHDNASGTAAIVTLAAHYAHNKPQYDMYFIAFSGEDANLRGSEWYASHPTVPLEQIKYLFNLDMIGDNNPEQYCEVSKSGNEGFKLMERINDEKGLFAKLNRGRLAANSDHYPFAKRGVPCIFLENKEGDAFKDYHTPLDTWQSAIFDSYEPTFRLVTEFVEQY